MAVIAAVRTQRPTFRASDVRASAPEVALPILRARLLRLSRIEDERGVLIFGEVGAQLPFVSPRAFMLTGVPDGQHRGDHAHRELEQYMVCVSGMCTVSLDDGTRAVDVVLDDPAVGLHVGRMVWTTLVPADSSAIVVVLASDVYDERDYIRHYPEFAKLTARG